MLKTAAYATARYSGLVAGLRLLRRRVPILCYHNVLSAPRPAGLGDPAAHMPKERFARQIEWLKHRYRVIALEELLHSNDGFSAGTVVLTFDDGYEGAFRHAVPLLESFDLPATVFVLGAPDRQAGFWWDDPEIVRQATSERRAYWLTQLAGDAGRIRGQGGIRATQRPDEMLPASWDTIRSALRRGRISVGAHSMTHRTMTTLPRDALQYELRTSGDVIRQTLGAYPLAFAYPYGSWSATTQDAVRESGYAAAVTLDNRTAGSEDDRWALPRINVPANISLSAFAAWLVNVRPRH